MDQKIKLNKTLFGVKDINSGCNINIQKNEVVIVMNTKGSTSKVKYFDKQKGKTYILILPNKLLGITKEKPNNNQ